MNLPVPDEDVLYELARLSQLTEDDEKLWLNAIDKSGDDLVWRLTGEMIRLVVMLVRQVQASVELDILCEAMSAITETGEGVELLTDCNVNEILVAARLCLHRDALKRRVDLQKPPYGSQPLLVKVKRGQVFLAVLELLENAVDVAASSEGNGWVRVSTHLLADAGKAMISVSNNVPSILEDDRRKSDAGLVGSGGETNLGLRFVREWVEASNGTVRDSIERESGIMTVAITVPLAQGVRTSGIKVEGPRA